ncbi:MAG: hypothetical protein IKD37_06605 [Clostridia bacterium]|nr:hypothetical protein [Clostridia bacterium]
MHPDTYTVTLPYPDVHPAKADLRLARLLFPLYSGPSGALCTLCEYLYAALCIEETHGELSRVLDAIADTERQHFRLLGRLLRDLGADPMLRVRVESGRRTSAAPGTQSLRTQLTQYLQREQTTADHYRYLLEQTDDEAVQALLRRILLDEEAHIRFFSQMTK